MSRIAFLMSFTLAALGSPSRAATERASVEVSLRVEPTCAAQTRWERTPGKPPVTLACTARELATERKSENQIAYATRTVSSSAGTVVSFEF